MGEPVEYLLQKLIDIVKKNDFFSLKKILIKEYGKNRIEVFYLDVEKKGEVVFYPYYNVKIIKTGGFTICRLSEQTEYLQKLTQTTTIEINGEIYLFRHYGL